MNIVWKCFQTMIWKEVKFSWTPSRKECYFFASTFTFSYCKWNRKLAFEGEIAKCQPMAKEMLVEQPSTSGFWRWLGLWRHWGSSGSSSWRAIQQDCRQIQIQIQVQIKIQLVIAGAGQHHEGQLQGARPPLPPPLHGRHHVRLPHLCLWEGGCGHEVQEHVRRLLVGDHHNDYGRPDV